MKTRNFIFRIFTLVVVSLAVSIFVSGQGIGDRNRASSGGSHVISGRVRLPDGTPAVGAKVNLSNTDIGSNSQSTDQDGNFTFSGMPEGNYSISVRLEGYQVENESF